MIHFIMMKMEFYKGYHIPILITYTPIFFIKELRVSAKKSH